LTDPSQEPADRPARVGVVDDDPSLRRALVRLLRWSGFEPEAYASAEEFLEQERPIDCLLLDIQLGGMSGLELQDVLRTRGVAHPVIFVTAHATGDLRARVRQAGGVGLLEKPVSADALLAAVRAALESHRGANEEAL
jgi:FixJ family two-component response regulator